MTTRAQTKLYTPALLGLATQLAQYPFDETLPLQAEARSRTCGSEIALGMAIDATGKITQIGMRISACAIGQASAALLANGAIGARSDTITATAAALETWLTGQGELPAWPGIDLLSPAQAHPGRHGALLLPWKAACAALSHKPAPR